MDVPPYPTSKSAMSIILPSISLFMASSHGGSSSSSDSFHDFFELWLADHNRLLQQLISASNSPSDSESDLRRLIAGVLLHYEQYYCFKSQSARRDVLSVLTPPWRSRLEDAFLWIGGWRPGVAFHLLYSKSGLQFEARLDDLLSGVATGDLGDLSPSQLARVDELQRETLRQEKELSESMAEQQEAVADSSMVQLTHSVAEMARGGSDGLESVKERVDSTLTPKEEGMREILKEADDLRLRTLRSLIDLLTPIQAVHFLIAAAELHIWVHAWGKKRDDTGPDDPGRVHDPVQDHDEAPV